MDQIIQKEKDSNSAAEKEEGHPSPADFDLFLPWACTQLQAEATVVVTKVLQQEYVSVSTIDKKKKKQKAQSRIDVGSDHDRDDKSISPSLSSEDKVIHILAEYDSNDNLVQLKFDHNKFIPRIIFRVIGLIIQYQPYLTCITINRGMDKYTLYEIYKFLPKSHITDLCLDNAFIKEANYHIILETSNFIRQLSLARCSITDDVVKTIAEALVYPLPSSKSLSILNLSSNRITDMGAKYLAEALRSNRQLAYLNLADNMISDTGAESILEVLSSFSLTFNELLTSRHRHVFNLKEKNELVTRIARDLKAGDFDRRSLKRKSVKQAQIPRKKGAEKELSLKSMPESKSSTNMDAVFLEKAMVMAESTLGEFKDPFNKSNTFVEDGIRYSYGNNVLCYLNLSYNNLSYLSVKRLAEVIKYQKWAERKPRGLVNVSIEGNCLPVQCNQLNIIDDILDMNLSMHQRRTSTHNKKKPQGRPLSK